MQSRKFIKSFVVAFLFSVCATAPRAQTVFKSADGDFTLELPSTAWRVVTRGDSVRQITEFVNNNNRAEGFLRIRKESVEHDQSAEELARRDQDQKLTFLPGFVAGRQERFSGKMSGVVSNYEYTSGGKPMLGRIYYLQLDPHTIYTLHFTGSRDRLQLIRNQTDAIARSFQAK